MRGASTRYIPFYPVIMLFVLAIKNRGLSVRGMFYFTVYVCRYLVLEPIRLLELLLFDSRIRRHKLNEDPLFILGHWRSGTSHLQHLLSKDEHYTTTTLYRFIFADTYYLTEYWLKRPMNWLAKTFSLQFSFQRVPLNFDLPGELDSGMCSIASDYAYTWGHLFPKKFEKLTTSLLHLEDNNIAENWIADYDYLIKKLSYRQKNKRVIIKSPGDTSRAKYLLKQYPNASFIYIHRDPIEVFHSSRYLWGIIQKENSFQKISKAQIDKHIIATYKLVLSNYIEQRKLIPESQLIEIAFNNLQQNPLEVLKQIYLHLNLGDFNENRFLPYIVKNKGYKINQYTTSVELEELLKAKWQFSFDSFS